MKLGKILEKIVIAGGVMICTSASMGMYKSFIKLNKMNIEEKQLQVKIVEIEGKIANFNNKISRLEDGFEREKIARNRLQMVKENEEIYRFINK